VKGKGQASGQSQAMSIFGGARPLDLVPYAATGARSETR
jgi:hypothetical protein